MMITIEKDDEITSTEKVQKTLDELGAVQGVEKAILVSEEGFPIMCARTTPISEETENLVSAMVAGIASTFAGACVQLKLGKTIDFIHVQTPLGLGLISRVGSTILVLITKPKVKLGLMHYLITSTKDKMLRIRDF
ncbi:MAG: roadblock/LC7 domain-containing protein [Candidatus Heimdallarchaeota archaeon]|nr:MAG: roadblock/LC7 domain-containing protein [Candidatus Heimdallarchaeota archaeon]